MSELLRPRGERSLGEIINFLKARIINPNEQQFEFKIPVDRYPISADELRGLIELPYEVALTESKGKVILNTGFDHQMPNDDEFRGRRDNSKLSLHTHHEFAEDLPSPNAPSFSDVYITDFASKNTPLLLVYQTGIMVYQVPQYDPVNHRDFNGEARDMLLIFGKSMGIDIFNYFNGGETDLRKYSDLTNEEKVGFVRLFAEKTRMIKQESLWDDPVGLQQILDTVNLRAA